MRFILIVLILVGCSHPISKKEAEAKIAVETEIFQKSRESGEYKKDIKALHKTIDINQRSGGELYEADMYYYLAELYLQEKGYSNAIKYYKKSANKYKIQKNRQKPYFIAISWLARLYMMQKDFKNSMVYHKEVIKIIKNISTTDKLLRLSHAYGNIAILYQEIAEYDKALEFNHKSLDILLKFYPNKLSFILTNYNNISSIKNSTGDYDIALEYLRKSLNIAKKLYGENDPYLSNSYHNLAIHYMKIGDNKKGLFYLQKALNIRDKNLGEDEGLALLYSTMGDVYKRMKLYNDSTIYHHKSIDIYKKLGKTDTLDIALAYVRFGAYYQKIENFDRAMEYYKKAIKIEENILGRENLIVAQTYEAIAIIHLARGEFENSIEYFEKILKIRERILGENNSLTMDIIESIGIVKYNQKDFQSSYQNIKKSFDFFVKKQNGFFSILDSKDKESYIKNNIEKIQLLMESYMELKDSKILSVIFDDWINYKGTLFDIQNNIARLYESTTEELKKEIERLRDNKRTLAKLYQQKPAPKEIKSWSKNIKNLEQKISEIEIKLGANNLNKYKISHKKIAKNLKDTELYIDYAKLGKRYFVFTLDSNNNMTLKRHSFEDSNMINQLIVRFRKEIKRGSNSKETLSKLYNILMRDINLKKRSLIISSDGLLRLFPFETLYNKKTESYLVEKKEIRYIPSAKELIRLYNREKKSLNSSVVIFSNPDFDANIISKQRGVKNEALFRMKFGALPETKIEAQEIKKALSGKNIVEYQKREANEENLLNIKKPKILHIATHGFFLNSNLPNPMLNSGIVLSGANNSIAQGKGGGVLTALKLSGLNLKGTELVVLSACESGVVDVDSTDSLSGLSKAFIEAGTADIVVSLWSVSDRGTRELMSHFYTEIAKGSSYSQALRLAKLNMIESGDSPFLWASFVLNGL
jgi:CHAT domain-containing protein